MIARARSGPRNVGRAPRVAARAGLGPAADDEAIAAAARSFGCTTEEVDALVAPVADDAESSGAGSGDRPRSAANGRMQ